MREIFELIVCIIFMILVLNLFGLLLWWLTISPLCSYVINRKSNKIEWKCVEDCKSKENTRLYPGTTHKCDLYYRTKISELNLFFRIFGDNEWHCAFEDASFYTETDFIKYVKDFKTIGDIESYLDESNGKIWTYP